MTTTQVQQKSNNLPLYSIIIGVSSLCIPIFGIIIAIGGIILSIIATRQEVGKSNSQKGLAITGLCCSIATIALHFLLILFYVVLFLIGVVVA